MSLTPKERAINKTRLEIKKDIAEMIQMAKQCGFGELNFFLHYLHFIRLMPNIGNIPKSDHEMIGVYARQFDEAYKYNIQLISKYCQNGYIKNKLNHTYINSELVQLMTKGVLGINSKFETLSFITIFNNIEVYGERDQYIKINFDELDQDNRLKKFFYYGVRADRETMQKKDNRIKSDDFLEYFKKEYEPYSDMYQKQFNISIDEFIEFIKWLMQSITSQIRANEDKYTKLDNGNVDVKSYETIMHFGHALYLEKQKVKKQFDNRICEFLDHLIFKSEQFDETQLQYNLIARQPIIEKDEYYIISPELILDSIFINSHYSLLETGELKELYKMRSSKIFVDNILQKAERFGFGEFARDLELYEGKNQIGDLDLVVKNGEDEFLLIEAKNHSLPMNVYFHDFEATKNRLSQLINEWENKVIRRQNHLARNYSKYGISSKFKYIIVSKSPEIVSHFSKYLILSSMASRLFCS